MFVFTRCRGGGYTKACTILSIINSPHQRHVFIYYCIRLLDEDTTSERDIAFSKTLAKYLKKGDANQKRGGGFSFTVGFVEIQVPYCRIWRATRKIFSSLAGLNHTPFGSVFEGHHRFRFFLFSMHKGAHGNFLVRTALKTVKLPS
jgi:hypothetical protein